MIELSRERPPRGRCLVRGPGPPAARGHAPGPRGGAGRRPPGYRDDQVEVPHVHVRGEHRQHPAPGQAARQPAVPPGSQDPRQASTAPGRWPDGRPHAIPIDGIWLDDAWYFGGAPQTVSMRNLEGNREIAMHLEDTMRAVIVEGAAEWVTPSRQDAERLAAASNARYGYGMKPEAYAGGVWAPGPPRGPAWEQTPH